MATTAFARLFARTEAFLSAMVSSPKRLSNNKATRPPTQTCAPPAPTSPCTGEERRYLYVLPVLFLEYLALSLSRALMPGLMVSTFGNYTFGILGVIETVKGILAFMACPLFGKLSDVVGRRTGLFITVLGTTLPILSLALTQNMWIYAVAQGLSGIFASTFTITFAYIADLVHKERRSSAYGLALATFGLSYCVGPILGGFLAERFSYRTVFAVSVALVLLAVAYIVLILPESRPTEQQRQRQGIRLLAAGMPPPEEYLPMSWSPFSILEVFSGDPILRSVSKVVFLYYTGVWAIVSTLMVHVQRSFHANEVTLGELMSVFGVCTMLSEGILVRIMVPQFGEKIAMQIGLAAFALQCAFFSFARHIQDVLFSLLFSTLANLVYPSVSSLVSRSVPPSKQGEALGAMNGIRALTEGFGPLVFGFLMFVCQDTWAPGAPYLLASACSVAALYYSTKLPSEAEVWEYEKRVLREEGTRETVGLLSEEGQREEEEEEGEEGEEEEDEREQQSPEGHLPKPAPAAPTVPAAALAPGLPPADKKTNIGPKLKLKRFLSV